MINLFTPNLTNANEESFETLLKVPNLHVEKITSNGHVSSEWYEQTNDEWVILVEGDAKLVFENEDEISLKKGEHIFIPRMKKHKVTYTSSPAIWLAIHF